jgi:hypothetical protein
MKKPKQTKITEQQMQNSINDTMSKDFKVNIDEDTQKALDILKRTQEVIDEISKDQKGEAKKKLANLIGDLEILITKNPKVSLIPVNVSYEIRDAVVDIETAEALIEEARKEFEAGYYQSAKKVLNTLSSEYVIKISFLPLATYPEAMKIAAKLLDEDKKEEALTVLLNALYILAVQEIAIPLPVLRAEEYIKAAQLAMKEKEEDYIAAAVVLLENAEYQLQLAEVMGYGKKDKEYKELEQAILELKQAVQEKAETESLFEKLADKIKKFKERLFFDKVKEN